MLSISIYIRFFIIGLACNMLKSDLPTWIGSTVLGWSVMWPELGEYTKRKWKE